MTIEDATKINDRLVSYRALVDRLQNLETCKKVIGEGADVFLKYRTIAYIGECELTGIVLPDVLIALIDAEITTCKQQIDAL